MRTGAHWQAPSHPQPSLSPHFSPRLSILLRKIQTTKPEVTKFTRGGISVGTQRWGLEGAQAAGPSPGHRSKPTWVDPTSSVVPAAQRMLKASTLAAAGGGSLRGNGAAAGRTKTFKDPANIAMDACPEKHLVGRQ